MMNHRPDVDAHFVARKRQYIKRRNKRRAFTVLALCAAIIVVWIFIINELSLLNGEMPSSVATTEVQTTELPIETTSESAHGMYADAKTEPLLISADDVTRGTLILVSDYLGYYAPEKKPSLITVWGNKSPTYYVANATLQLATDAFEAADKMFSDYNRENSNGDYQITMAYSDAQPPVCCDEHATGYAFDMNVYSKGVSIRLGEAEGIYTWVYDNAAKYGFVLRYPREKTTVTGESFDADHFRYVGKGHSEYMAENSFALEEYIGVIQTHKYGEKHLEFSYGGVSYEVFYVAVEKGNAGVEIEIPADVSYTLSGDNIGGVVVTLYK